jgi:hypothetical protein
MFPPGRGKLASRPVQLWVFHQAENGLTTLPVLRYRFNHRNRKMPFKKPILLEQRSVGSGGGRVPVKAIEAILSRS